MLSSYNRPMLLGKIAQLTPVQLGHEGKDVFTIRGNQSAAAIGLDPKEEDKILESVPEYVRIFAENQAKQRLLHHYLDAKKWAAPAGRIEPGENHHDAAVRELLERTGYTGKRKHFSYLGEERDKAGDTFYNYSVPLEKLRSIQKPQTEIKIACELIKQALRTERQQTTETAQVARYPSAVVIQGNQDYIKGNSSAKQFYSEIADYIRQKGYTVQTVKGEESGQPPGANVWVSHGGFNPPKGTKVLNIPQYPRPFVTKHLVKALDKILTKR